jgi:hypothetical protein
VELATGPLPAREARALPRQGGGDPWGEFLQRVLPSVRPDEDVGDTEERPRGGALLAAASLAGSRADLSAG